MLGEVEAGGEGASPLTLRPLRTMPFVVAYALAGLLEAVFALCCGRVPCRKHAIWRLTRSSLLLSATDVTQSLDATRTHLGWEPEFTTLASFDHMLAGWRGRGQ